MEPLLYLLPMQQWLRCQCRGRYSQGERTRRVFTNRALKVSRLLRTPRSRALSPDAAHAREVGRNLHATCDKSRLRDQSCSAQIYVFQKANPRAQTRGGNATPIMVPPTHPAGQGTDREEAAGAVPRRLPRARCEAVRHPSSGAALPEQYQRGTWRDCSGDLERKFLCTREPSVVSNRRVVERVETSFLIQAVGRRGRASDYKRLSAASNTLHTTSVSHFAVAFSVRCALGSARFRQVARLRGCYNVMFLEGCRRY